MAGRAPSAVADPRYGSARLAYTLRRAATVPGAGFGAALELVRVRAAQGLRRPEGVAPYVLSACAGAALLILWLKVGALVGWRGDAAFHPAYLAMAAALGAALGLAGQLAWGALATAALSLVRARARAAELRFVWGAAALPQLAALLLVPLDLALAGPGAFTSTRLPGGFATAWLALSIALAVALAAWSGYLVVRGTQVAAGRPLFGAAVGLVGAPAVLLGAALLLRAGAGLVARGGGA